MDYLTLFKYCPKCGSKTKNQDHDDQVMPTCENKSCGFIHWYNSKPAVAVIIRDDKKRILMTVRGIEPDKGKLDMPGGFAMFGEQLEDAAVREVKEELGIEMKVGGCVGHLVDDYFYQGIDDYSLVVVIEARIMSGKPRAADKQEIAGIEWVNPATVDTSRLAFTFNEIFMKKIAGNQG
jgi:ADP-ribose pyrophosphatase YjhB (NUDIX family)